MSEENGLRKVRINELLSKISLTEFENDEYYIEQILDELKWEKLFEILSELVSLEALEIIPFMEKLVKYIPSSFGAEYIEAFSELVIKLGDKSKSFIPTLDELIESCEVDGYWFGKTAIEALKFMSKIGSVDIVHLVSKYATHFVYEDGYHFIGDANKSFRLAATKLLGEIGSPKAIPALAQVLEDCSEEVIVAAVYSLGEISDRNAIPYLYRMSFGYWFYDDRVSYSGSDTYPELRFSDELKKQTLLALEKIGVKEIDLLEASIQFIDHFCKVTEDYELFIFEDLMKITSKNAGKAVLFLLNEQRSNDFLQAVYYYLPKTEEEIHIKILKNIIEFQKCDLDIKKTVIEYYPPFPTKKEAINYLQKITDNNESLKLSLVQNLINHFEEYDIAYSVIQKMLDSSSKNYALTLLNRRKKSH